MAEFRNFTFKMNGELAQEIDDYARVNGLSRGQTVNELSAKGLEIYNLERIAREVVRIADDTNVSIDEAMLAVRQKALDNADYLSSTMKEGQIMTLNMVLTYVRAIITSGLSTTLPAWPLQQLLSVIEEDSND